MELIFGCIFYFFVFPLWVIGMPYLLIVIVMSKHAKNLVYFFCCNLLMSIVFLMLIFFADLFFDRHGAFQDEFPVIVQKFFSSLWGLHLYHLLLIIGVTLLCFFVDKKARNLSFSG